MEIFRYLLVGGMAFVLETLILWFLKEFIFTFDIVFFQLDLALTLSTMFAFLGGLMTNYFFSLVFVFQRFNHATPHGHRFLMFSLIGLVGLLIKTLGMNLLVEILLIYYLVSHGLITVIVLVWNYLGRKLFIFKETQ